MCGGVEEKVLRNYNSDEMANEGYHMPLLA
jgi:hypothetical protein